MECHVLSLDVSKYVFILQACKYSLRLLGPLIGSENMNNMFQKILLEDAALHYGEFMNDLSKVIVSTKKEPKFKV